MYIIERVFRDGDFDHTLQTWFIDWIDPLECLFVLTDIIMITTILTEPVFIFKWGPEGTKYKVDYNNYYLYCLVIHHALTTQPTT